MVIKVNAFPSTSSICVLKISSFFCSWLTLNVPIYWRTVSDILGPYFNELLSYLCSAGVYVQEASQPIRIYVLEHGSVAVQFVSSSQILLLCV